MVITECPNLIFKTIYLRAQETMDVRVQDLIKLSHLWKLVKSFNRLQRLTSQMLLNSNSFKMK